MYQSHKILEYPEAIDKDSVAVDGKGMLKRADNEVYFESHGHRSQVNIEFGVGGIILGLWLLSSVEFNSQLFLPVIAIFGGGFSVFYGLFVKKKYKIFELNRYAGTITYPDIYFRPPLKGKFNDIKAVIAVTGNIDGYIDREYLKFVNTFKPRKLDLLYTFYGDPKKDWSFYVWYMDKNRPLPPGTAFDPYRKKDFERRKAEGFPKPLYPSNILTPEATPEQQKERKKIGGW